LRQLSIPPGVTSIEARTFGTCLRLTQLSLPSGVASIGSLAFHDCAGLRQLSIPAGIRRIGDRAFDGVSGVSELSLLRPTLSLAIMSNLEPRLSPDAKVVNASLAGLRFGGFTIVAG
jgi:hypothetical protein